MTYETSPSASGSVPPREGILRHSSWLWLLLVIGLFCVPLFVGTDHTDVENDEAGYSYGVEKMLATKDWLTPRGVYDGESPFLEKPPLKFWIVALPIHWGLLPDSPFGLRFWDAVMGSLAFLYVFAIGRRLAGPVCGAVAVLLLFTNHLLMFQHGLRTNNMEAALLLQYAGSVYHYLVWRSGGVDVRGRPAHLVAIALYFVLGFMTKFVAALFAPFLVFLVVVISAEDRRRLWRQRWAVILSGGLAVALIAPWFLYQYSVRGSGLFDLMFGLHVVRRFTAGLDQTHVQPWHYYFVEIWSQLRLPGQLLVAAGAVLMLVRTIGRRWIDGAFVLLWFLAPVGLLSFGTSKLSHYIYPFLPPVALAGGYAAAAIASWVSRLVSHPVEAFASVRDRVTPAVLTRSAVGNALTAIGLLSLAIAAVTYLFGALRLDIGPLTLRNSVVDRPVLVAIAALAAGASVTWLRVIVTTLVVAVLLPWGAYAATVREIDRIHRPFADLAACLTPIVDRLEAEGRPRPGVWVEAERFGHMFFYYLRHLGPWQARTVASDSTVAMHLFGVETYRPVMLSEERLRAFQAALFEKEPAVLTAAARKAGLELEVFAEQRRRTRVGAVAFEDVTLLLPGPYAACGKPGLTPILGPPGGQ